MNLFQMMIAILVNLFQTMIAFLVNLFLTMISFLSSLSPPHMFKLFVLFYEDPIKLIA